MRGNLAGEGLPDHGGRQGKKSGRGFGDQFQEELEEFPAEKSNILVVTGRTLNLPWLKKRLDALG